MINFALLNKVKSKKKEESGDKEFDIVAFFNTQKESDRFFNNHLIHDSNPLLDTLDLVEELTTINEPEDQMSLLIMLKEH